jgi:type I restriction enzyme M protein
MDMIENRNSIEHAMSKIWTIFDILKNSGRVNSVVEQAEITLLLLSLYKDGIPSTQFLFSSNIVNEPIESYGDADRNYHASNLYKSIFQLLGSDLSRIDFRTIEQIRHKLLELDNIFLSENFPAIFDSVLYQISKSQGRYAGEFVQPAELSSFICKFANLPLNAKVYNPFAGVASIAVFLEHYQEYIGQEIDQSIVALGALRILAYGKQMNTILECKNSIEYWPKDDQRFDLIVSTPPFNLRLNNLDTNLNANIRTAEQFLIQNGVKSLRQDGKLIAVLPQGFLFRSGQDKLLREQLINDDLIDTVISLPSGLLSYAGVNIVVLVLNKSKALPNKVRFVNAESFVKGQILRDRILDDEALMEYLNKNTSDNEFVRYIDNEQIHKLDYNLNVSQYFQKRVEGIELRDILDFFNGEKANPNEIGKLIRIRDLKDNNIDFKLEIADIDYSEVKRTDIRRINASCLLLAVRWKSLKPSYFNFQNEPIYRNQDILSFKVKSDIVDVAYLVNELQADYVLEQIDSYRMGATIPFIRKDDLLKVVVKLPSIEEQRAKVQGLFELSDKIKTLQSERNALAHGSSIKQFNEFASLKHTLGRPRQNILGWSKNMIRFFESNTAAMESLDIEFRGFYEKGIVEALHEIKSDINFITNVLEKGEHGLMLSEYELKEISLKEINSIVNGLSNNGFNFKIRKLLVEGNGIIEKGISGNTMLLRTLFDNLLTNANKHGFAEFLPSNEVVIELTEMGDNLLVEVKNNGKPFPKNFDRDKFISKYSTQDMNTGSGLGGYDIQRIAEYLGNPEWELLLNSDPFYPVKFKFLFPIKLIS